MRYFSFVGARQKQEEHGRNSRRQKKKAYAETTSSAKMNSSQLGDWRELWDNNCDVRRVEH